MTCIKRPRARRPSAASPDIFSSVLVALMAGRNSNKADGIKSSLSEHHWVFENARNSIALPLSARIFLHAPGHFVLAGRIEKDRRS